MAPGFIGRPRLNREVNRQVIIDRIRQNGQISRPDLARATRIGPPTVAAVIAELIHEGLVEEVGNGESSGGRAPRIVALSRKRGRAMGFEISGSAIRAGVCDLGGALVGQLRTDFAPDTPERTIDRVSEIGDGLLADLSLSWKDMYGVGVAVPGLLDAPNGVVRWSRPFGWRDVALRRMCELRWGTTTDVVNNSVAGSMAEHFLGGGREARNLIFVQVRFNVVEPDVAGARSAVRLGGGIIVNGEPYHGEFGAAGEISNLVSHPLVDAWDESGGQFADTAALVAALQARQAGAEAAMDRVARDVGASLVPAVNFLNPGVVVIGSDVPELRDALLDRLQVILDQASLAHEAGQTRVIASTLGEYGIVRGAIVPTLRRVFRMPRWV